MTATCKCGCIFLLLLLVQLFTVGALKKTWKLGNETLKKHDASLSSKNYIFWRGIGREPQRKESVSGPTKETDSFKNIENILFDRKLLKHYVLHYLWTHPRKLDSLTSGIVSRKRHLPSYSKQNGANPQKRRHSGKSSHIQAEKTERTKHKVTYGPNSIQQGAVRFPAGPVNKSVLLQSLRAYNRNYEKIQKSNAPKNHQERNTFKRPRQKHHYHSKKGFDPFSSITSETVVNHRSVGKSRTSSGHAKLNGGRGHIIAASLYSRGPRNKHRNRHTKHRDQYSPLYGHASSHLSHKGQSRNSFQLRKVMKYKPGSDGSTMKDVTWSKHSPSNGRINHKRKYHMDDRSSEFVFDRVNRQEFFHLLQKFFNLGELGTEPDPSQSLHRYKQTESSAGLRWIDTNRSGKKNISHKNEIRKNSDILGSHKNHSWNYDLIVNHQHAKKDVVVKGKSHARNGHKREKSVRPRDSKTSRFLPSWKSLDKRVIPSWYDDAKFGIFVHWGVYSVPSFGSEWFWFNWKGKHLSKYLNYTEKNFHPGFSYADFAPMFKTEFFDPRQWARLVARSGARYFVFTGKHHEGFANWNSSVAWNWNSVDVGPHRNIVDELAQAFRNLTKVKFGLYYSLYEWFNPHYLKDKANNFQTDEYVQAVVKPQLYDLVNTYQPDYLWADGDWEAPASYWKSKQFLTWLFNASPVRDRVVVNDRWGLGSRFLHGGVYTGLDRYNPGKLRTLKWENAMTIDRKSWGFRREANIEDYFTIEELIKELVSTVSCGGNLLMNVGPAADGTISPIFQERLTQMGDWLKMNGEAIFGTRPWRAQRDSFTGSVWYTCKGRHVYAISLKWPQSGKLELNDLIPTRKTRVMMLGVTKGLKWNHRANHAPRKAGLVIHFPSLPVLPCTWAWVLKLSHVK